MAQIEPLYPYNSDFNFLVRQISNPDDKKYPRGKIACGLFFQGLEKNCFIGLVDKDGGNNSTRSVCLVFKPSDQTFKFSLVIVFQKETNKNLIEFYKTLASKFEAIEWDSKGTKTDKRAVSSSEISFSEISYREHFN